MGQIKSKTRLEATQKMKLFSILLIARLGFGHDAPDSEHAELDAAFPQLHVAGEDDHGSSFNGTVNGNFSSVYELEREERARKSQDNQDKKKKPLTSNDIDLPDPILGDEPEGRGQHRCGNVPIPPIVCVGGKCPVGYPRYDRPCNNPMELRGKFKCRVQCGDGWRVAEGMPKKMKCLGKEGKMGYFKVRPKTFGHRIECVQRQ